MVRIVLTDTGIVLDGQRVEGAPVRHAPWYPRISRLGVPVNSATQHGVSIAVPVESVSDIRCAEIPASLTFEVASLQGTDSLNHEVFDPESFFSVMSRSWVVAKGTLYFVAWSDQYRPLDGAWYAELSGNPAFPFIPILAMAAAGAHVANVRLNDNTLCAWTEALDPATTVMEALRAAFQQLMSISEEYARLAERAHQTYAALVKEKAERVVDAIRSAAAGRSTGSSVPGEDTEIAETPFATDDYSRTYTRFPANQGIMEIDAKFLNVALGDVPLGITVKVTANPGTERPQFYTLTDIVIRERHVRFRVSETQYVEAAHVVETFRDLLGSEASPPTATERGTTFEVEVAPDERAIAAEVINAIVSGIEALAGPAVWRAAVERVLRDHTS